MDIFGYASACIFGTISIAMTITPVIVIPLLAFAGFYINQQTIPIYFYWIKYASYFGYSYEAVAINEWSHIDYIPGNVLILNRHQSWDRDRI
jgi:hypothetical protein